MKNCDLCNQSVRLIEISISNTKFYRNSVIIFADTKPAVDRNTSPSHSNSHLINLIQRRDQKGNEYKNVTQFSNLQQLHRLSKGNPFLTAQPQLRPTCVGSVIRDMAKRSLVLTFQNKTLPLSSL